MTRPNHADITIVLDASSSMRDLLIETIDGTNSFIKAQQEVSGTATFSLVQFNGTVTPIVDAVDLKDVKPITTDDYVPSGMTALHDAIGMTIERTGRRLAAMPEDERPSKVIVFIGTDGHENSSREFGGERGRKRVKAMIEHQAQKYGWEISFAGANIDAVATGASLGLSASNVMSYAATPQGTHEVFTQYCTRSTRARVGG